MARELDGEEVMKFEYHNVMVLRVIDGDTIDVRIDHGFKISSEHRFRLLGINAPELKGDSKEAGIAAKSHLLNLIEATGNNFTIRTVKDSKDKYGRYLATLIGYPDGEPCNLNDRMVRDGHAEVAEW